MRKIFVCLTMFALVFLLSGFKLDNAIVPQQDILSGGPPKDGIPAILKPRLIRPHEARFLGESDAVIGVRIGDHTRAYPLKILNWHEVVNDTIGGVPVAVTF